MSMGFGSADARTFMATPLTGEGAENLLKNVVMANAPQLVFSLIYFSYNGIFTTISLAIEWSGFGAFHKGLRRSGSGGHPLVGAQRAAYFLQLPYRLALPLLVASGALHWLISQSIFLVYFESYVPMVPKYVGTEHRSQKSDPKDIITCAWSPPAVLCTIILASLMLVFLLFFGLRRLPTAMPVAGSCSAAIAAACHPPAIELEEKIWEKKVRWGMVLEAKNEQPGHCSFSSGTVVPPVEHGCYM